MNDPCPNCGLLFEREDGYFLGAMYVSFTISMVVLSIFYFVAAYFLPTWNTYVIPLVAILPYLPLMPAVFRYSRVLWIYYDRMVDPQSHMSGPYERMRLKQLAKSKAEPPPEQRENLPGSLPPGR